MNESIKKFSRVCRCENCGNEAEMVVTCSLENMDTEHQHQTKTPPEKKSTNKKIKGTATCKNCGNEADMWIDL